MPIQPYRTKSFLVMAEPDTIGVSVNEIKVIGAFSTDSIHTARRIVSGALYPEMLQDWLKSLPQTEDGWNLWVTESNNKPDLCVFASRRYWSRHWSPAEQIKDAKTGSIF